LQSPHISDNVLRIDGDMHTISSTKAVQKIPEEPVTCVQFVIPAIWEHEWETKCVTACSERGGKEAKLTPSVHWTNWLKTLLTITV